MPSLAFSRKRVGVLVAPLSPAMRARPLRGARGKCRLGRSSLATAPHVRSEPESPLAAPFLETRWTIAAGLRAGLVAVPFLREWGFVAGANAFVALLAVSAFERAVLRSRPIQRPVHAGIAGALVAAVVAIAAYANTLYLAGVLEHGSLRGGLDAIARGPTFAWHCEEWPADKALLFQWALWSRISFGLAFAVAVGILLAGKLGATGRSRPDHARGIRAAAATTLVLVALVFVLPGTIGRVRAGVCSAGLSFAAFPALYLAELVSLSAAFGLQRVVRWIRGASGQPSARTLSPCFEATSRPPSLRRSPSSRSTRNASAGSSTAGSIPLPRARDRTSRA